MSIMPARLPKDKSLPTRNGQIPHVPAGTRWLRPLNGGTVVRRGSWSVARCYLGPFERESREVVGCWHLRRTPSTSMSVLGPSQDAAMPAITPVAMQKPKARRARAPSRASKPKPKQVSTAPTPVMTNGNNSSRGAAIASRRESAAMT